MPCFPDVKTITGGELAPVNLLCGGSPCQDLSLIGPRTGFSGRRSGLWKHMARLVGELQPTWVVWENVPGARAPTKDPETHQRVPAALASVLADLDALGYDAIWITLSAAGVGAPHLRNRIFVLAGRRVKQAPARAHVPLAHASRFRWPPPWVAPRGALPAPGEPRRVLTRSRDVPHQFERIEVLGNAVVPAVAYVVGRMLAAWATKGAPQGPFRPTPTVLQARGCDAVAWIEARLKAPSGGSLFPLVALRTARWEAQDPRDLSHPLARSLPAAGTMVEGRVYPAPSFETEARTEGLRATDEGADAEERYGLWPTATRRDYRSGKAGAGTRARNARPLSEVAAPTGYLNPAWVERLMGFPEGYTELPIGTLKPRKRGSDAC